MTMPDSQNKSAVKMFSYFLLYWYYTTSVLLSVKVSRENGEWADAIYIVLIFWIFVFHY